MKKYTYRFPYVWESNIYESKWNNKKYFSHLILSIIKHSGRWIFFCRICNVKRISCIGPSA